MPNKPRHVRRNVDTKVYMKVLTICAVDDADTWREHSLGPYKTIGTLTTA